MPRAKTLGCKPGNPTPRAKTFAFEPDDPAPQESLAAAARQAETAADALRQLAEVLPSEDTRRADAVSELNALQVSQTELTGKVHPADGTSPGPEQATLFTEEQRAIAEKVAALDTPGSDTEQRAAIRAAAAAVNDLARNHTADIAASQQQLQQALAALSNRLQGQATPREQVARLAR